VSLAAGSHFDDLGNGQLLISSAASTWVAGWEPLLDRWEQGVLPAQAAASPLVGPGHAFFVHSSVKTPTGTSAALTGIALEDDGARLRVHQSPVILGGTPTASAVDDASRSLLLSIPVEQAGSGAAPLATHASGQTGSVVTLRADTLAIDGLVLDDTVTGLGVVGGFGYALHPGELGDVTFFPVGDPTRANARRVSGFLAGHLLDQGETP
jgi:hypothetical protein